MVAFFSNTKFNWVLFSASSESNCFYALGVLSRDPAYLSAAGKAVYNALTAADPQAVW